MEIRFLLEKYKQFTNTQEKIKKSVCVVFVENKINIEEKDIQIKNDEIFITCSGVRRVEFILLKNKLNSDLQKEFEKEGLKIKTLF